MPGNPLDGELGMAVEVKVEVATAGDLPALQAMALSSGVGPLWPAQAWQTFVQPTSDECVRFLLLIARSAGGELLGWLAASRVAERSELEFLLVSVQRRRQGVAGRLVDCWTEWARKGGVLELALEVRPSNEPALRFYGSKGFVEQGRRPRYYERPAEDAVLMGLTL